MKAARVHKVVTFSDTATVCGKECKLGVTATRVWEHVTCSECMKKRKTRKK